MTDTHSHSGPTIAYFASDLHLGVDLEMSSRERERLFVQWLDEIKKDATVIYLLGDLFEFWHEYKTVVPRGYVRLLGKLAEIADSGIPIHAFTGNHDLWMYGYFEEELGIPVYHKPIEVTMGSKHFFIGHGDGLGPGDKGYKRLKKLFTNKLCQWAFKWVHPNISFWIASLWAGKSRESYMRKDRTFKGAESEWLYHYAKRKLEEKHYDYFIFGHRHLPLNIPVNKRSNYINLGDWINHFSYAKFDGEQLELLYYKTE